MPSPSARRGGQQGLAAPDELAPALGNRAHIFATASLTMRSVLREHARAKLADKLEALKALFSESCELPDTAARQARLEEPQPLLPYSHLP